MPKVIYVPLILSVLAAFWIKSEAQTTQETPNSSLSEEDGNSLLEQLLASYGNFLEDSSADDPSGLQQEELPLSERAFGPQQQEQHIVTHDEQPQHHLMEQNNARQPDLTVILSRLRQAEHAVAVAKHSNAVLKAKINKNNVIISYLNVAVDEAQEEIRRLNVLLSNANAGLDHMNISMSLVDD